MIKKLLVSFAVLLTVFSIFLTIPSTPVSAASDWTKTTNGYFQYNTKTCKQKKTKKAIPKKTKKQAYKKYTNDTKEIKKKVEECKAANKTSTDNNEKDSTKATVNTKDIAGFTNDECSYLLGMVSWNCHVNINNEESLKSGIWTIVANVLTDLTVIAAYLVIGYVIYGGYQYMLSNGDPGKVANGKKTLVQAFIGLAIVILSNVILNTIRIALGANFADDCTASECVDPNDMVTGAIQWVIGVAGVVAVVFVVIGGISYATSAGDSNKLQKAKQTILYAIIGLILVALAEVITAFVSNMIRTAEQEAFNNEITIAKEVHENKTI